jgi:V8-like Glu-specific endopeptidase
MKHKLVGCALAFLITAPSAGQEAMVMQGGDVGPVALPGLLGVPGEFGPEGQLWSPGGEFGVGTRGAPGPWVLRYFDPRKARPMNPQDVGASFAGELRNLTISCQTNSGSCAKRDSFLESIAALGQAESFADCSSRGGAYVSSYPELPPSPGRNVPAFDVACMASLEPRMDGEKVVADTIPTFFTQSAGDSARGALKAVGVLEIAGRPFCTALLRSDRTLVTAAHCYNNASGAWGAGSVTVRSIDGSGGPWKVKATHIKSGTPYSQKVGDDWAVFGIEADQTYSAPHSEIRKLVAPGEVTVIGYFNDYKLTRYGEAASSSAARRAVRWSKPGLCRVVEARPDCLRLVCQTFEGFSGAPVFRPTDDPQEPLQVVGFVSGANEVEASPLQCGSSNLAVTVAASPTL